MSGFILLFRQSIDSEVFQDPHLWHLFSWCLFRANYKDKVYRGTLIPRGSFACGRHNAAEQLGIAGRTWYDRMKKLEAMGCITIKSNSRFTLIDVEKYEQYQSGDGVPNNHPTTNQQPSNSKPTTIQQPSNTRVTKEQGNKGTKEQTRESKGFVAPDLETVKKQCETKGYPMDEAEAFFLFYDSKGWMVGKNKMVRWPSALAGWMRRSLAPANTSRGRMHQQRKTFQQMKTSNIHEAVGLAKPAIEAGMSFDDLYAAKQKANQEQPRLEN